MGMFDYFRSAYDLGEQFTNVVCQTKDIETGKEKVYPMDEDFMNRLKDRVKDVELDDVEEFEQDWKTLQEFMKDDD